MNDLIIGEQGQLTRRHVKSLREARSILHRLASTNLTGQLEADTVTALIALNQFLKYHVLTNRSEGLQGG